MANVVVTGSTSNTPNVGRVFDGIKFFLAQRVPSRTRYVKDIEANGGRVVKIEQQADYKIADHMRKDAPPGSYSFELIDVALRNGQLPDPADHAIRPPGSVREAGSAVMGKATRTPYTIEDDKFLWNWVKEAEARGESTGGNEIYKKIEAVNPRHTWQSWRDHFVKVLSKRPPTASVSVTVAANPPPSPPITAAEVNTVPPANDFDKFDEDDFEHLMVNAEDIEAVPEANWADAWQAFAGANTRHTADEWIFLYEHKVRAAYQRQLLRDAGDVEYPSNAHKNSRRSTDRESPVGGRKRKQESPQSPVQGPQIKKQKTVTPERESSSNRKAIGHARSRDDSVGIEEKPAGSTDEEHHHVTGSSPPKRASGLQLEPVLTSDLNTAANVQLEQEAGINLRHLLPASQTNGMPNLIHTLRSEIDLPTSDANRAAEAQLEDERVAENGHAREENDVENHGKEFASHDSQHGLTAANLASQQAHYGPPIVRGTDLPQDEANDDQTNFADYLQTLTGHTGKEVEQVKGQTRPAIDGHEEEDGLPDGPDGGMNPSQSAAADAYLPLSSQQEVDDAFEHGLNWPSDPQQRREQNAEREAISQQQPHYPELPSQPEDDTSHIYDAFEVPAQALMSQLNDATSSHRRGSGSQTQDSREGTSPDFDTLGNGNNFDGVNGHGASHQDAEIESAYELGDPEDDELEPDLSLAEPDSGFEVADSQYEIDDSQREPARAEDGEQQSVVVISSDQSSSPYEGSPGSLPQSQGAVNGRGTHAVETQDIVNAETQFPDLNMPQPFDSDAEPDERSSKPSQTLPPREKSKGTAIEAAPLDTAEKVNSWVSTMVVRGYKRAATVKALKRTCMRPDLALLVLLEQGAGKGLPDDVPGVWSEIEDEILESGDGQGLAELQRKHGWEEMDVRMGFLEDWRGLG